MTHTCGGKWVGRVKGGGYVRTEFTHCVDHVPYIPHPSYLAIMEWSLCRGGREGGRRRREEGGGREEEEGEKEGRRREGRGEEGRGGEEEEGEREREERNREGG
jgi:hypothetical protein